MKGDPQLFDADRYKQGQGQLFDASQYEPTSGPQPQPSRIAPKVHPGQFQMFMTPREIRGKYQALDADRQEVYGERAGQPTARSHTTAGDTNWTMRSDQRRRMARWHGGTDQVADYTHIRADENTSESDDQLFARKLDESQMSPSEYRDVHAGYGASGPGTPPDWSTLAKNPSAPSQVRRWGNDEWTKPPGVGSWTQGEAEHEANVYREMKHDEHRDNWQEEQDYGPSLHERIRDEGIQNPVHLSYGQMGSLGKPQIVGGHHRLAAQEDIDPDAHIPVQHWENIHEAKGSGKYD